MLLLLKPQNFYSVTKVRRLRASSTAQWVECPGSVKAQDGIADKGSFFALEGTAAHSLAQLMFEESLPKDEYLGYTFFYNEGQVAADAEMINNVDKYLEEVKRFSPNVDALVYECEVNVPIGHVTGETYENGEPTTGQIDRLAVYRLDDASILVHIHDLKYGKGVLVDSFENKQLLMYTEGVRKYLDWVLDGAEVTYRVFIHQPRLNGMTDWSFDQKTLDGWVAKFIAAADLTREADAKRVPGTVQCRFCSAQGTERCPESTQVVAKVSQISLEDANALSENWELIQFVEKWAKAARARLQDLLEAGHDLPNLKLVSGKSSRVWKLSEDETLKKLKSQGLKVVDIYEKKFLSPAKAEKVLGKEKYHKLAEQLVLIKEGNPTIAYATDKRPSVTSAEAQGFSDITK